MSCGARLCELLRQRTGRAVESARAGEMVPALADDASRPCAPALQRSVFGMPARQSPAVRLETVAREMRVRISQLEGRAGERRVEAARMHTDGQKANALRMMRKVKAVEGQISSQQAALDAVEQQIDMLEHAAVQKQLTNALASTSKSFKKDTKALCRAEAAIDSAAEARDTATELGDVVAEFARVGHGEGDDDELMAELDALVHTGAESGGVDAPSGAVEDDKQKQIDVLERKIAIREARAIGARLPSVPDDVGTAAAVPQAYDESVQLLAPRDAPLTTRLSQDAV